MPLDKKRTAMAGREIVPGYKCVLDGVQADQDYLRAVFQLKRYVTRQQCCHLCAGQLLQWRSNKPGEPNDPNRLFTIYGPGEDTGIISTQEFQQVNGDTPLTRICGFDPCRLYPDVMHIVHLSLIQDLCCSVLLDLSDPRSNFGGANRDAKLLVLWNDYRAWCEEQGIGSRASRRLFSSQNSTAPWQISRALSEDYECNSCSLFPVLGKCHLACEIEDVVCMFAA